MLEPGSVLAHGAALVVPFLLAVDNGHSPSIGLHLRSGVDMPVEVVPVQTTGQLLHGGHRLVAKRDVVSFPWLEVIEILLAVVGLVGVPQRLGHHLEVVDHFWEARRHIVVPVRCAISDHKSFEVDSDVVHVELGLQVVLVDLPGEVRNIDSSVTLA